MDLNLDTVLVYVRYLSVGMHFRVLVVNSLSRAFVSRARSTVRHTLSALGLGYLREHLVRS